ncbi:UDP-glycosyltransferase [Zunongwangia sp. SCSIO 43204]|uniref:UDP-glycosyltransferase n=1 Tax=Zunongwangia sp. SCSIO 43204 TaxID=2779359 RepID=UPI001CAA3A1E|nr:UDP-glycosyltransferase [Zunongwangia sp. SCSIO 43204]UAB86172.1 UDP-glycosyltransferase [Zunongwangia sp. SCSIO 43204]
MSKKIFVLLPDGVGLRNFGFTNFTNLGKEKGWDITFWNQTPFELSKIGLKELKLEGKPHFLTDLYKRAKIEAELEHFTAKFNDPIYQAYKFPPKLNSFKAKLKWKIVQFLAQKYSGEKKLIKLREKLANIERGKDLYKKCIETLQNEQPAVVFCTNQRPVNALAPLLAAKDLRIPTATFIFSWDNLPKATKVVKTDYYFVWSDFMASELIKYYPEISEKQIKVTGTPQFEPHFTQGLADSKSNFYKKYNLDPERQYLCYSGDDITTAPHDELYLRDVAKAVRSSNNSGKKIGIIFRRCPVDFSDRYDKILEEYQNEIVSIDPLWEKQGSQWNAILPTKEDLALQTSIIANTFMVINVGSSMVFDYVSYKKPCGYINYNPITEHLKKDTCKVYNYVHFQSKPSKKIVFWINSENDIEAIISKSLEKDTTDIIEEATKWFRKINKHPANKSSERIWEALNKLAKCT